MLDALLLTPHLSSFPELAFTPVFRRAWPSLYAALQSGRVAAAALLKLLLKELPAQTPLLLVGDHTAWARPDARTLSERTIEHQPTPIKGQKPITVGYGFSTLGLVPELRGSWFLPLLHQRIAPAEAPGGKMCAQLQAVLPGLPERPLVLLDSEYGTASFLNASAPLACDLSVRLRPTLSLRRAPPALQRFWASAPARRGLQIQRPTDLGPPRRNTRSRRSRLGARARRALA